MTRLNILILGLVLALMMPMAYAINSISINCSDMMVGMPFIVNGSAGFQVAGDSTRQYVWTNCRPDLHLYYDTSQDYYIGNDTANFSFEVESGNGTSSSPDDVWAGYVMVMHMAYHNATHTLDSSPQANDLVQVGNYTALSAANQPGCIGACYNFSSDAISSGNSSCFQSIAAVNIQYNHNRTIQLYFQQQSSQNYGYLFSWEVSNVFWLRFPANLPLYIDAGISPAISNISRSDSRPRSIYIFGDGSTDEESLYGSNISVDNISYINKTAGNDGWGSGTYKINIPCWHYTPTNEYLGSLGGTVDEFRIFNGTILQQQMDDEYSNFKGEQGYGMLEPGIETCSVCNETCSPCGGGCTATSLYDMFDGITNFDAAAGNISGWDTSCITNMAYMFANSDFNQSIDGWDVSNVTDMSAMFSYAYAFNRPLGNWSVGNVVDMTSMFNGATYFNQDLSGWDVGNVTSMAGMFSNCNFNQPIGGWDIGNVNSLAYMFAGNTFFNRPLGGWDTADVTNMEGMFSGSYFNQDIGGWDTHNVTLMDEMFYMDSSFNYDIGAWDTSKVMLMYNMFNADLSFDHDIGGWNISQVTQMDGMFMFVNLSMANYDSLLIGWASQTPQTFVNFDGGYSLYSSAGKVARDILTDTYNWTIIDAGLGYCWPDWYCSNYQTCTNGTRTCLNVSDHNECGTAFEGNITGYDYSCIVGGTLVDFDLSSSANVLILLVVALLWLGVAAMAFVFDNMAFAGFAFFIGIALGLMFAAVSIWLTLVFMLLNIFMMIRYGSKMG